MHEEKSINAVQKKAAVSNLSVFENGKKFADYSAEDSLIIVVDGVKQQDYQSQQNIFSDSSATSAASN